MNDPIIVIKNSRIIFHNKSSDKLFEQYNIPSLDKIKITASLSGLENSFILLETGLKLPVNNWQEIVWMKKPSTLIFLKKSKRREIVPSQRKKVTSTLSYDTNQETVMFVKIGLDGILLSANENYCNIHQLNPEEIYTQPFLPLTHQIRKNSSLEEFLSEHNHLKQPYVFDHHMLTEDNEHYWEEWSILPIYNQSQKLVGLQGIGRDITEIKWNEEVQKVILNISQATVRENKLEDLFQWIQHELNTLMPAENMYIALCQCRKKSNIFPILCRSI